MKRLAVLAITSTLGLLPQGASAQSCNWPAWDSYKKAMMSSDGRIIDGSSAQMITTSEGQSYGLFFALLGNDKKSFARILEWTRNNLAGGSLEAHLPAWQWGLAKNGKWQILDSNNASDADLWIAYSLLEAGRLWQWPEYVALGQNMLWRSAAQSLRKLPGLGLMLLPGDVGFDNTKGWRLNPSYLPPQLLARFARISPIWAELASNQQRMLIETSPKGFARTGWCGKPLEVGLRTARKVRWATTMPFVSTCGLACWPRTRLIARPCNSTLHRWPALPRPWGMCRKASMPSPANTPARGR
ncbi:MAG: hypothetical protein ACFWUJ_17575 [Pseudomonas fragi]